MKGIKQYLRGIGLTQKEFADLLGLSRPTLDNYIDLYEAGEKLPKERYQIIFDDLFLVSHETKTDFLNELSACCGLLNQDRAYGTMELSTEDADLVSGMIKNIRSDVAKDGWEKNIYIFINMLLSNYRENEIFLHLAEYFLVLNGVIDKKEITKKQRPYFAKFYQAFRDLVEDDSCYKMEDYQAFLWRCEEIQNLNQKKRWKTQKELMKLFQERLKKNEQMGIEYSEEDLKNFLKNL